MLGIKKLLLLAQHQGQKSAELWAFGYGWQQYVDNLRIFDCPYPDGTAAGFFWKVGYREAEQFFRS